METDITAVANQFVALTGGKVFASDHTNASRTRRFNIPFFSTWVTRTAPWGRPCSSTGTAVAIGLATGVGQWPLAIFGTVFLLALLGILLFFSFVSWVIIFAKGNYFALSGASPFTHRAHPGSSASGAAW